MRIVKQAFLCLLAQNIKLPVFCLVTYIDVVAKIY